MKVVACILSFDTPQADMIRIMQSFSEQVPADYYLRAVIESYTPF